jgi:radical SAM superfamily enzyme YgiQ (UPF0313 family)
MPLGLTALGWHIGQLGFSSKILHLTIEELLDKKFDLIQFITQNQVKVVALDLHWHPQTYRVIETARQIKRSVPDIKILLGGFTASLFAKEILAGFPEIDFVIKGDAEIPLAELLQGKPLSGIPNLVWREAGQVRDNRSRYTIDQGTFDRLEYHHLDIISHHEVYDRIYDYEARLIRTPIDKILKGRSFAYYNAGRGCPVNCAFCGGGDKAQCLINQRHGIITKSIPSVLKDLKGYLDFNIENIYTSFDPLPAREYYLELFKEIKRELKPFDLHFECWTLPDRQFMDAFAESFSKDSVMILSPDSGSEKIRKLNKGYFYSNQELLAVLDQIYEKKIKGAVYFSVGFPFEGISEAQDTSDLMKLIKKKYHDHFKISFMPIELDPGSPMWFDNKKFKITADRKTFNDLYLAHRTTPTLGYRTEAFSSEELIELYKKMKREL